MSPENFIRPFKIKDFKALTAILGAEWNPDLPLHE